MHVPAEYLEDLCFDAQQAAEKAIKAVFICRGERFPYVHDLEELLQILERNGLKIPKYVWEAEELSRFAVVTRCPGMVGPVTKNDYRRAGRIATGVQAVRYKVMGKGVISPLSLR
ncbi:MAG TPA: HEPN domain-containing protein [Gemmataceae bacterium]|nr:HEPN domain-containing protein [Gemmataceae bacterium]